MNLLRLKLFEIAVKLIFLTDLKLFITFNINTRIIFSKIDRFIFLNTKTARLNNFQHILKRQFKNVLLKHEN